LDFQYTRGIANIPMVNEHMGFQFPTTAGATATIQNLTGFLSHHTLT
jgi:hypothetical protein